MQGKRGLVVGIANQRSLALGIARAAAAAGARLAITYQNDRLKRWVLPLADDCGAELTMPCDLMEPASLDNLVERLEESFGRLDFVVHAVAFARREDLGGRLLDTPREGFDTALSVSSWSFIALLRALEGLLGRADDGASALTLSYYGAEKVIPGYNVMGVAKAALEASVRYLAAELGGAGIRVNAISSGPVKTLSAAGISGFRDILSEAQEASPLGRGVDQDDIGRAALGLLSPLGGAITGEIVHVDAGLNTLGMW